MAHTHCILKNYATVTENAEKIPEVNSWYNKNRGKAVMKQLQQIFTYDNILVKDF